MNFLGPYKYVIDIILIALIAFGVHKYNTYQQDIGAERVQLQWDKQRELDRTAAETLRAQYQKEKDDALAKSVKDVQIANATASAATASSRVLDSTIQTLLARSASGDVSANRKYTAALAEVFGDCKDKYRELGRQAQGHADDSLMYQLAWPTGNAPVTQK